MRIITVISLCCFLNFSVLSAQDLGEFKPSLSKYGLSNFKKAPKRIFISSFTIKYEVYKDAVDYKREGGFRNTKRAEATARAAIGLGGVQSEDIQQVTNKLYNEFVADLESSGYAIITIEEAEKIEKYQGWQKVNGPFVEESGLPGVLQAVPSGYSYMIKGKTKKGKEKKGALGGVGVAAALSKQLGDAVIVDVDLVVMFSEDKESLFKGNAAKVKILTNLRLVDNYAVTSEKKSGLRFKGDMTVDYVKSKVNFYQGKVGLGNRAAYEYGLKNPLEINGIVKKEKVVAYQKGETATNTSFAPYATFNLASRFSKTTKWIDVDSKKYAQGLYNACQKLLKSGTDSFLAAAR